MVKENNKIGQPLILMCYAIVMLFILSLFKLPIGTVNGLNKIDIIADIRVTKPKDTIAKLPIAIEAIKKDSIQKTASKIAPPPAESESLLTDYCVDYSASLQSFFDKLDSIKQSKKKIRIAYFGDSFIEGDEITDEIRSKLQSIYGGNGIGFMPIQSAVAPLYKQININSTNWKDANFKENPNKYPLGLSGHLFYADGEASVSYTAKPNQPFTDVKLYFGKTPANTILTITKDGKQETVVVEGSKLINEITINQTTPIKNIKIATSSNVLPIYGASFENPDGIYLDNYAFRGNSSVQTQQLTKEMIEAFNAYLHYDLIIIHYGINAVEHDMQKNTWFENSMHNVIQTFKNGLGNVPMLIVSTSDRGYKYPEGYATEKGVPVMVAIQKNIAQKHQLAFWNLYEAMGGENTMVKWVKGDTVLAYKDYTHVNDRGAKRIAHLFTEKLHASKKYYQTHNTAKN